ncbi:MAG TPA: tetratricopeptide repeat protein [Vicinamibacteria bacterium]|jgi:tetratricopeptide (TPR) repeat protein
MRKELKRQIKQDELVGTFQRAAAWVRAHVRELRVGILALAAAVALVGGWRLFEGNRQHAAAAAYAKALETYHAPTRAELGPGGQAPLVHASEADRWRKARDEFDAVAAAHGSREAGRRARYYAALCRARLGETAEAEKALGELAQGRQDPLVASLARMALADLHRQAGRVDKAADAYRQMVDDSSFALPRDHALMMLAALFEEARRAREAQATYRRVADEFPASVYAAEARRRADYLGPTTGQAS